MKIKFLILCIVVSVSSVVFSQSKLDPLLKTVPLRNHFTPNDYKGGSQCWSFDQDHSGVLYVANNNGLLEFDGKNWTKHLVPSSGRIRAVKVAKDGKVFVGGQGQIGYFERNVQGFVFTSLVEKLPSQKQDISETWKILEFDDKIFFNTESELFVYQNESLQVFTLPGYIRFIFNVNNRFYIQFYEQGLYEMIEGELKPIANTNIKHDIVAMFPNGLRNYCVTREGEMYVFDEDGLKRIRIPVHLGIVNDALRLNSGAYVVATQSNGLFIFDAQFQFLQHLTKNRGLSGRTTKALYEDQFHNLWIALHNGIDYLKLRLPFSLVNEGLGVEGTGYGATRFEKGIYVGTNNGVFVQKRVVSDLEKKPFDLLKGSEGQVYGFSKVQKRLILNHDRGAFEIEDGSMQQINDMGSWKFLKTPNDSLWLNGSYTGFSFYRNDQKQWERSHGIPDFIESIAMFEFENDSTLWATHVSKGAFQIPLGPEMYIKDSIRFYGAQKGFPSKLSINVFSINDKLIFTSEDGVYDFNREKDFFEPNVFLNQWLGQGYLNEIVSNKNKAIYYVQDLKFGELKQKKLGTYEKETAVFKHINKYINDDHVNISLLDDDNVLIGAKEGFVQYNPNRKMQIHKDFEVLLKNVSVQSSADSLVNYNPLFLESPFVVLKENTIKLEYAAPYFDGFEDLQYSYRLVPMDDSWSKWTALSEKEFSRLPYGNYRFEVKAKNIYGAVSQPTIFSFQVFTPWYWSRWALVGYAVLGLFVLTLIPLIQRKKHKVEKNILTENKEKELQIKNEEIDKLTNDKLKTELNFKNEQLTSVTMQLMKNNEFIQEVQGKITSSLGKSNAKQDLKRIVNSIDKKLSNNDSWDQFAYHFDQVHGGYLKKLAESNIKLSPREIKLAAFLRMNMSSKEISKLLNITVRGVELARYRLRKKLNLEREQNLVEYLIALDDKP